MKKLQKQHISKGNNINLIILLLILFPMGKLYGQTKEYDSIAIDTEKVENIIITFKSYFNKGELSKKEGFYSDGKKNSVTNYSKGEENGYEEQWWENGKLKSRIFFEDGKIINEWQEWFEDGTLKFEVDFGKNKNICKTYYETGAKKEITTTDNDFVLIGKCSYWCNNGQLIKKVDFNNNLWNNFESFHCNGKIANKGIYTDFYYRSGLWQEWYDNGQLYARGFFKERKPNSHEPERMIGEWKFYFENGKIAIDEYFNENGMKNGIWKYYSETDGHLLKSEHYENDVLIDENGKASDLDDMQPE